MPPQIIHILRFLGSTPWALSYGDVGGWLAGWVSVTAGIVSKRLNLSENFLDHLVGPSFKHLGPLYADTKFDGEPLHRGR